MHKAMRIGGVAVLGTCLIALGVTGRFHPGSSRRSAGYRRGATRTGDMSVIDAYGNLPLSFEPNRGQADPQAKFIARGAGYGLFLTPNEAVLALKSGTGSEGDALRMQFLGANAEPIVWGVAQLPGTTNYFIGNDPAHWHTGIPNYSKVEYTGLYAGIDVTFHGTQGGLEYDLNVAPGADPTAFGLSFPGANEISIDLDRNLLLRLGDATLVQHP